MSKGWVPLHRKMYEPGHWLSPTKRDPSNRRDAWCDLFQMATNTGRETAHAGTLKVGELVASLRTLGDRWSWSKDRVSRFMSDLEVRTAIETVRETPSGTVYRIVNYDTYALFGDSERDTPSDSERDRSETAARQEKQSNNQTRKEYTSDFEQVWTIHGRGPKRKAFDEYRKAVPKRVSHDELTSRLTDYVSSFDKDFNGAHLFRWIRDERWEEHIASNGNGKGHWADKL